MRRFTLVFALVLLASFIMLGCASGEGVLGDRASEVPDDADLVRITVDAPADTALQYVNTFLTERGIGTQSESSDGRRITTAVGDYYGRTSTITFRVDNAPEGSYIYASSHWRKVAENKGAWRRARNDFYANHFFNFVELLTDLAPASRMEFINSEEQQDGGPIISER